MAASRGRSNVQRTARGKSASRGADERALPRSGVRARSSKPGKSNARSSGTARIDLAAASRTAEHAAAPNAPGAYQQMYVAACSTDEGGRLVLDTELFARALAEARVGVIAEQQLYHLGVLAAAEGHAALATEDVMAALTLSVA